MKTLFSATRALVMGALLLAAPAALADGPAESTPDVAAPPVRAAPLPQPTAEPAATGRSGQILLRNGEVVLNVPETYKFYSADEARAFLTRNNAAVPSGEVLGLIAPVNARLDAPDTWATVLSYEPIGYVRADTAGALTDTTFEADVRAARQTQNRPFEGFAAQPAFDEAGAGLAWAERAAAPGAGGRDLRHEQRLLGRRGVAGLTSIGSADQQGAIAAAAPDLVAMTGFGAGNTYADFQTASDQVSTYSVPGLVTGVPTSDPALLADTASAGAAADVQGGGGLQGMYPWIALGVAVLAGGGYLLMRRRAAAGPDPNLTPEE